MFYRGHGVENSFGFYVSLGAQVPATTCSRLKEAAQAEFGNLQNSVKSEKKYNHSRDAMRAIRRMGVGWRVPLDIFKHICSNGEVLKITYMHPKKLAGFLMEKHPMVLLGNPSVDAAESICEAYWEAYRNFHGTHEVYRLFENELRWCIPIAVHGDEGRGKRRSNTTVVSWEAVLGLKGKSSCDECVPSHMNLSEEQRDIDVHATAKSLRSNMQGHSFLQHFPCFVLPGTLGKQVYEKLLAEIMEFMSSQLSELFYNGFVVDGVTWRLVVVGCKADLKWHSKVCKLTRGFENKSSTRDLAQCHWCHAGMPGVPAEEQGPTATWTRSMFTDRPWLPQKRPYQLKIPFDSQRPEYLYKCDQFHCLRLGLYRHFAGSCIFRILRTGFFLVGGQVHEKLDAAWGHFKMWQTMTGKRAALRSFSPSLFNYDSRRSYPWINCKASDCLLCLEWIISLCVGVLNDHRLGPNQLPTVEVMLSSARLAVRWFKLVYGHGLWLSPSCGAYLYEVGASFLKGYAILADHAWEDQQCLWALVPKFHFHLHTVHELWHQLNSGALVVANPVHWDCSQNEDFIGRMSRLTRRVDIRVCTSKVLEFYLVKAAILFQRHFGKLKASRRKGGKA